MTTAAATRVLLVEDSPEFRLLVRSVLKKYPHIEVVGEAHNGAEACASIETLHPTVILMDINMPVMNGIEATRWIKERHPDILVIGLTLNDDETMAVMRNAGACCILTKDRVLADLYAAIDTCR